MLASIVDARSLTNRAVVALGLAALVGTLFWPVIGHDFVAFDDERYVTANPHVQQGLGAASLRWACTSFHAANWHPLTWLSHMLDWRLYGPEAAGHHLTSLLLHISNALVLFLVLDRATASRARSALVAALFGVHPLHVESVAWVAERKDLLSTLFWLLALAGWVSHVRRPRVTSYARVALLLALALAAKPMAVTAPFTLLLLDGWPLGRLDLDRPGVPRRLGGLVREKLPLLALALASATVTLAAQRAGGALAPLESYSLGVRAANAVVAYTTYLARAVWPAGLAVPYPHPGATRSAWTVGLSLALFAATSLIAWRTRRRHPHLLFGWLWYVGTLVPVIGLVQVGSQAAADRYTYVPLIGPFVSLAWSLRPVTVRADPARAGSPPGRRDTGLLALACIALPLLALGTRLQLRHWRDDLTLALRAVAVTQGNAVAHNQAGLALARRGDAERAVTHFREAIALRPSFAEPHNNLAGALAALGRHEEALRRYREALAVRPAYPEARLNLGVALVRGGDLAGAIEQFREALRLRPDYGKAHANLAAALLGLGDTDAAWREIERARDCGYEPPADLVRAIDGRRRPG
jgi:tetratricopeptide (TPR) repeat protein